MGVLLWGVEFQGLAFQGFRVSKVLGFRRFSITEVLGFQVCTGSLWDFMLFGV